jgi:peptidyl-dipeptidase Dcp
VPRDFVEFPSQVNEMWSVWPEVLQNFARHYQTGAPVPPALLERYLATKRFNQGFLTLELVDANTIDQAWHQLAPGGVPGPEGVVAFETAALQKAGLEFAPVPPRYRSAYYSHIFSSPATRRATTPISGPRCWMRTRSSGSRPTADSPAPTATVSAPLLLSRGGSDDAMALYRNFAGRAPEIGPLLVRRGLGAAAGAR